MAVLAQLLAELEAIKAARRSAERRIRHKGPNEESEVEYKTDDELAAAQAATEAELAALATGSPVRTINVRNKQWS